MLFRSRNAPLGGCITQPGNTLLKDASTSREGFVPVFNQDRCISCAQCTFVCPDHCFVWRREEADESEGSEEKVQLVGIDYRYCKGCMRCLDSCPSGALTRRAEEEGFAEEHRIPLFSDVTP